MHDYLMVVNSNDYHKVVVTRGEGGMKFQGSIDSAEDLGRFLQQGRLLAGLSQRELADKLGVSQRYLWEMESGKPSVFTSRLFDYLRQTNVQLIAELDDDRVAR